MKLDPSKDYACVVDSCKMCGQGKVVVLRQEGSGTLFVSCEDCESEWLSPEDALVPKNTRREQVDRATPLERDELLAHEWAKFLVP
jgi:hypothetical protein